MSISSDISSLKILRQIRTRKTGSPTGSNINKRALRSPLWLAFHGESLIDLNEYFLISTDAIVAQAFFSARTEFLGR